MRVLVAPNALKGSLDALAQLVLRKEVHPLDAVDLAVRRVAT